MEHVSHEPMLSAIRRLIRVPSASGFARSAACTLQVSSSMDFTASMGLMAAISDKSALCARRYRSGFCGTRTMSGHRRLASSTGMTFLTPRIFASREQAITQVRVVPANGTTPTGRPRKALSACCSTLAKKPSKSR
jgi:hypothetical protein